MKRKMRKGPRYSIVEEILQKRKKRAEKKAQAQNNTPDKIIEKIDKERKNFKKEVEKAAKLKTKEKTFPNKVEQHYRNKNAIENERKIKDTYAEIVIDSLLGGTLVKEEREEK